MRELKRIDLLSAAKVSAIVSAIWGFIAAIISLPFMSLAASSAVSMGSSLAPMMLGLGIASIIISPIVMAIMGFVVGAVGAFFYNVAAKYVGGVKLDL